MPTGTAAARCLSSSWNVSRRWAGFSPWCSSRVLPHRGKDHGFLSLLKLLRPSEFNPQEPLEAQVHKLRTVMIRNNKRQVTDMRGDLLFTPVRPQRETYSYSPEEAGFYQKLTDFITTGKAYAAGLGRQERRMAILVLITMQKLASSSVAAIRRTLARRLARLQEAKVKIDESAPQIARIEELLADDDPASMDELSRLEEQVAENLGGVVNLNPNEIPALEELLAAADDVAKETKIERILQVVEESFASRSVLFFTEYKATQALLMSELQNRYGDGCVTFNNCHVFVEGVKSATVRYLDQAENRRRAAGAVQSVGGTFPCFNRGGGGRNMGSSGELRKRADPCGPSVEPHAFASARRSPKPLRSDSSC